LKIGQEADRRGIGSRSAASLFYPRFSGTADLGLFRIGGSGLANSLYLWAKSLVLAERHGGANVFPTWPQVKLGPLLRREPDPRHYIGLFRPADGDIAGVRKLATLATGRRIEVARVRDVLDPAGQLYIVTDGGFADHFEELLEDRTLVRRALLLRSVRPPSPRPEPFIGIHVRFGDFQPPTAAAASAIGNHRLPIEWYIDRLEVIRRAIGHDAPAVVFSDASPAELAPLLAKPSVTFSGASTALDDLWSLSQAAVIIASGSTFSYWGGYLGDGVVVTRSGAWRTSFDLEPREWICTPDDSVVPPELMAAIRRAGL
jgi:hypothetical protein